MNTIIFLYAALLVAWVIIGIFNFMDIPQAGDRVDDKKRAKLIFDHICVYIVLLCMIVEIIILSK